MTAAAITPDDVPSEVLAAPLGGDAIPEGPGGPNRDDPEASDETRNGDDVEPLGPR